MDISLSLINSNIMVVGESSSYPREKDCYKITITTQGNETSGDDYFPKTKLELIRKLQSIQDSVSLDEFSDLIQSINNHIGYESDSASYDAAMYYSV